MEKRYQERKHLVKRRNGRAFGKGVTCAQVRGTNERK